MRSRIATDEKSDGHSAARPQPIRKAEEMATKRHKRHEGNAGCMGHFFVSFEPFCGDSFFLDEDDDVRRKTTCSMRVLQSGIAATSFKRIVDGHKKGTKSTKENVSWDRSLFEPFVAILHSVAETKMRVEKQHVKTE